MLFDVNLLFWHTGSTYAFTGGEYVDLAGATSGSTSLNGSVINLGTPRDLGIGDGEFIPHVAVYTSAGITSACASTLINARFQGSTDSTTWTTYAETGALSTASFGANTSIFPQAVPRRPFGVNLPQYYRLSLEVTNALATTISAGTLIGGIVIQRDDATDTFGEYSSGFTVA